MSAPALTLLAEDLPLRRGGRVGVAFVAPPAGPQIALRPERARATSLFEVGSLTKTMTATLLAKMVIDGAVTMETTVGEMLGTEAGEARDISLRELATHTSGLPRLAPNAITFPFWPRDPYRFYRRDRLGKGLQRVSLKGRGEVSYSNLGFDILGCCLSAAADQDFNVLLREAVFIPAGMTTARCQPCPRRGLVRGRGSLLLGGRRWHQPLPAAGGVDCSIEDLACWLHANVDPALTPLEEAIRMTQRPHATTAQGAVGLAWHISNGLTWHNGATGAFHGYIGFVPGVAGVATLSSVGVSKEVQHDRTAAAWLRAHLGIVDDGS